jgi:hypothetical protein
MHVLGLLANEPPVSTLEQRPVVLAAANVEGPAFVCDQAPPRPLVKASLNVVTIARHSAPCRCVYRGGPPLPEILGFSQHQTQNQTAR